ncbi:hypothetical protein [Rhizobium leguminosarum]|uniref:hypothetical protein n=1 Tax=Rhizobium leguminosarum TaxID=384 RepID=UPI001C981E5A|nr:hypothetical protein [Rhizobium leguminosarum]MBY5827706.1 hypothetical protein [Rhizobium leguminosarum]
MDSQDDIFQAVADFLKGKTGSPDLEMARLSVEGNIPPEALRRPELSSTYAEFSSEYRLVAIGMAGCSLEECLAIFGSMLSLPEFQSNDYRLSVLVQLAFIHAKGNKRPTAAQIVAWFNQLDRGTCGRMEDPAEDVFVSSVNFRNSSYRLIEGTAEGNAFHTQMLLEVLTTMPDGGPYFALKNSVESLLRLSDAVVDRTEMPVYGVGNTRPVGEISKPNDRIWAHLRSRSRFAFGELARLGIEPRSLVPFLVSPGDSADLQLFTPGHSPVEVKPVYPTRGGIVIFFPAMIGTAVRTLVIQSCIESRLTDVFHLALANAYQAHFFGERFLGTTPPPLVMARSADMYTSQVVKEVDEGRYFHFLFFVDGLSGFEEGGFIGMNSIDGISDFVEKSVSHAYSRYSANEGFREGLTIVVGCGWGRALGLKLPKDQTDWRIVMMPAHDASTLSRTPSFETLDFLRLLDGERALHQLGIEIQNGNGLLNMFAWVRSNDGHLFPHERAGDEQIGNDRLFLSIPLNSALRMRKDAYESADVRELQRPDGSTAKVRRAHGTPRYGTDELSPFYADTAALDERIYRSVYLGRRGTFWCEAYTSPELDLETRFRLSDMAMHWCELVFEHFDTLDVRQYPIEVSCAFKFLDERYPTVGDPVPNEEDIAHIVILTADAVADRKTIRFDVKAGFLSASRRADNLGERSIVRAIVSACFKGSGTKASEDEILKVVDAIVRTDGARHFHAFTNPKLHDFVREDIPTDVQLIERMDDANIRIGLAWSSRSRTSGRKIEGLDDCKHFLRSLVDDLVGRLKQSVSCFCKRTLIERLLRNHEAAFAEMDTWKRTFGAVEALSRNGSLAAESAIEKLTRLNAATLASRVVVEAAISHGGNEECPTAGTLDIAGLLAIASMIHHMGGYSEAMVAEIMPPVIKISVAGEVMMDHSLSSEVISPFGQFFQNRSLEASARQYSENYVSGSDDAHEGAERVKSEYDRQFEAAWNEEFGFEIDDLRAFVGGIDSILTTDRKAVIHQKLSELVGRVCNETGLPEVAVRKCLDTFASVPRDQWDSSQEGHLSSAWFPWQFRRSLSLVSKPFVYLDRSDDPGCLMAPAMTVMNITKFAADLRAGAFDQRTFRKDGLMFKWIGRINGETGEAFNENVAREFATFGWATRANLSDGAILDRPKDPKFGDVDVLAWDAAGRRVLVTECKDLSFDKTIGEIARRLSNYQGSVKRNGKRDDLKKHLDRCDAIEANLDKLSSYVGFDVLRVERVLLFSQPTPLQFTKITERHSVIVSTFDAIGNDFSVVQS